jgi:hypothetical protein
VEKSVRNRLFARPAAWRDIITVELREIGYGDRMWLIVTWVLAKCVARMGGGWNCLRIGSSDGLWY